MSGWTERAVVCHALLLTLLLAGCGQDPQRRLLDDYLERVARVTEADVALRPDPALPPYPADRALTLEIPERSIDVLEFVELHGCDMGDLVGLRNSPLGRLQGASQRLGYEAAWLAAVERCGADAAEWMTELGRAKSRTLPALFWNATFAGPEMREALGFGVGPGAMRRPALASGDAAAGNELADLLRALNDSLDALEAGRLRLAELEQQLARLGRGRWLGPARLDWSLWRRYLTTAAMALDAARPAICLNGRPTPRSRILSNVFMQFYVQRIQPELASRMRAQEAWLRELTRLAGRLAAVQPAAFTGWLESVAGAPDGEWPRTREAVVQHARAWQRLFAHCGIEPIPGLGQD